MNRTTPVELLGELNEHEKKNAPKDLYYIGNTTILQGGGRVSIVGSRDASKAGLNRAAKLARLLVAEGVVVVSGLAKGIDKAAHESAIQNSGWTIAVIGTAIDRYYPAENRELQDYIADNHLLISQFAPGERTYPSSFTQRNRTMALISDATVIVEAGEKSGTIHQGWEAIRLGRPLFILKSLADTKMKWIQEMLYYGAILLSDENISDVFDSIPMRSKVAEDVFSY